MQARVLNPGHEGLEIDAAMLPRATIWQFATPHGDIDVLHEAPGAGPYAELRERALSIALAGTRVPVAGRDDLTGFSQNGPPNRPLDSAVSLICLCFEVGDQRSYVITGGGQLGGNHVPDEGEIDAEVVVDQLVAHPGHLAPRHVRGAFAQGL